MTSALQTELIGFPQTLSVCGADAIVLDETDANLSLVAMHLGMPYVSVTNAFHSTSPDKRRHVKLRLHGGHKIGVTVHYRGDWSLSAR
jgi:hypothetical protein